MAISSLFSAAVAPPKNPAASAPAEPLPPEPGAASNAPLPFSHLFAQAQRVVEARAAAAPRAAGSEGASSTETREADSSSAGDAPEAATSSSGPPATSDRAPERRAAGRACVRPAAPHATTAASGSSAEVPKAAAGTEPDEAAAVPLPTPVPNSAVLATPLPEEPSHAMPRTVDASGAPAVGMLQAQTVSDALAGTAGPDARAEAGVDGAAIGPAPAGRAASSSATAFATSLQTAAADRAAEAAGTVPAAADGSVASPTLPPGDALAALAAAPGPASAADSALPVPDAPISLATPVTSPEFRQALGVQVSVLARDGRQQASLQLHPVELGPISVRIAMDGDQARVDFACEVASTRDLISAGWPELATALQDAGFTLSGGGVSQQPSGQSAQSHGGTGERGQASPGREAGAPAEATVPTPAPARLGRVRAGGVDVFA